MNARRTAFLLLFSLATLSSAAVEASQPSHLRVVWQESPSSSAFVSWTTDNKVQSHVVWDLAPKASVSAYSNEVRPTRSGSYDSDADEVFHHARLEGLPASTPVHFRIVADDDVTRDYWFMTAPDDARPFVLLYGGDSRSDSRARRSMNDRIKDLVAADPTVIALVHGGDYVERGSSWAQWDQWLRDWQTTVGADGRVLPIVPARGNHESNGELYNRVFAFPGDANSVGDWWTTRLGEDFLLINLDSNVSQAGLQRDWLERTLAEAQKYRWIAVNYHRPAYPAVKSPGGALYHWVPLFERFNVDMVLESDGHVLKRTMPIRDGQFDSDGVVYLGEGGLGVGQRTPDLSRWYLQPPGMAVAAHHVQALRVTPDAVYYSAILEDGKIADTYTFHPRRRGQYSEPTIRSARLVAPDTIEVVFDRAVLKQSAENRTNYALRPAAPIARISYAEQEQVVRIETGGPVRPGTQLVVDGVADQANKAAPRAAFSFAPTGQFPVPARLEEVSGPTPTAQIAVRPIGPPVVPQQAPFSSMLQCRTTGAHRASGSGLAILLVLGFAVLGLLARRRPQVT